MTHADITRETVQFESDGQPIAGLLFRPASGSGTGVICEGPLTSVKEQVTFNYAQALARQGFVTLTFDHRFFGASGGEPRQFESPPKKIADLLAAVTFLASRPEVQPDRIGLLGVCAGAGYAAGAVAADERIRAFGAVAGFFHDAAKQREWMGAGFDAALAEARAARELYERSGENTLIPAVGRSGPVAMPLAEAYEYYGTARGAIGGYVNAFALQSRLDTLTYDAQSAAERIHVPTLLIHSEKALAPALARQFHERLATSNKRMFWFESQGQIDFYDQPALIEPAAAELTEFFEAAMR